MSFITDYRKIYKLAPLIEKLNRQLLKDFYDLSNQLMRFSLDGGQIEFLLFCASFRMKCVRIPLDVVVWNARMVYTSSHPS